MALRKDHHCQTFSNLFLQAATGGHLVDPLPASWLWHLGSCIHSEPFLWKMKFALFSRLLYWNNITMIIVWEMNVHFVASLQVPSGLWHATPGFAISRQDFFVGGFLAWHNCIHQFSSCSREAQGGCVSPLTRQHPQAMDKPQHLLGGKRSCQHWASEQLEFCFWVIWFPF